jgi:CubicO group peptidase (beta-lactamase class C family)
VQQVSGRSFAEFLQTEIFSPLGMSSTVAFEKGISTVRNRAYGHSPDPDHPGTFLKTDQSMTSSVLGDGGIYSSIRDLLRWDQGLRQGSVLSSSALRQMLSPYTPIDEDNRWYGLGWYLALAGTDTISYHGGSTVGFRTCILRVPSRSSAVIALFNRSDAQAEDIAWKLAEHFGLITAPR